MQLDPQLIQTIAIVWMIIMSTVYFFRPPRWVDALGKSADAWISDLRQWAPRLVGAVKHGTTDQVVQQAQTEATPLVQTLLALAELAPLINNVLPLLEKIPLLTESLGSPKEASTSGGWG